MNIYQDKMSESLGIRSITDYFPDYNPNDFELDPNGVNIMSGELNPFYGLTHSDEVKKILSEVDKSYTQTEEYRQNMSTVLKKRNAENPRSQKWCDNVSKSLKGKVKSKDHINKISKTLSDGRMAGENNGMHGLKHSNETRQKMSKALKGKFAGENNPMYGHSATKGKKWYNNGKISGRFAEGEQPEGYIKGRLSK